MTEKSLKMAKKETKKQVRVGNQKVEVSTASEGEKVLNIVVTGYVPDYRIHIHENTEQFIQLVADNLKRVITKENRKVVFAQALNCLCANFVFHSSGPANKELAEETIRKKLLKLLK